jgi:lipid A 3-O-deacylase
MTPKKLPLLLPLVATLLFLIRSPGVLAGSPEPPAPAPAPPAALDPAFQHGVLELQLVDGAEWSEQDTGPLRPNIDYELTALRLGYMLDAAHNGGTFLRGNDEILLEGVGGVIFHGPGTGLGGLALLYRRNFLAPNARIVPYIMGGGGGLYNDAYHDQEQRALGSKFEFDLPASIGVRFRVTPLISIDAEIAYRHISNADTAARNLGVNSIGGVVGMSYTF